MDFRSPYDVPPAALRVAGIAPFLVCLPVGLAVFFTLEASFRVRVLLALPFWAVSLLSPSDLLAFCYPQRFQEIATEHEKLAHSEVLRILVAEFRS